MDTQDRADVTVLHPDAGRVRETTSAFLGAVVCTIIAFAYTFFPLGLSGGSWGYREGEVPFWARVGGFATPVFALVEIVLLWWLWTEFRKGREFLAVRVALRQPRLPLLLRPMASAYWAGHFAMAMIPLSQGLSAESMWGEGISLDMFAGLFVALFVFGCTVGIVYAANTFLLLSVASFRKDRDFLLAVWRRRLRLSAAVALVLAFVQLIWNWSD